MITLENFNYILVISKFYLFWLFIYLLGRALLLIISYIVKNKNPIDSYKITDTPAFLLFPIIGFFFLGNILFLVHFFIPLKNNYLIFIVIALLCINLFQLPKISFSKNKIFNFLYFFMIPVVLLFSTYDINFHYDAGFYHLNHQLWLRESNLVIGFVNLFWPFGIDSIFEYISAFLWVDVTFNLIHFTNLIFILTFYGFLSHHLLNVKSSFLKFPSLFIIIFSIFDNVGFNGGRNGFFYIQSLTAQDLPVGILFFMTSLMLINSIRKKNFIQLDFHIFIILILFLVQIKLSVVFISFLLFIQIYIFYRENQITFVNLLNNIYFYIILFSLWTLKSVLINGCLIFPLEITCIDSLSWYEENSTLQYQTITTSYSMAYTFDQSFSNWASTFWNDEIRKTVLINFTGSLIALLIIRSLLFKKEKSVFKQRHILVFYILINIVYFILAGPTPRYGIGLIMFSVSSLGFNIVNQRFKKMEKLIFPVLLMLSILSVPRISSYQSFSFLEVPKVIIPEINYVDINENWVKPEIGDKCWVNLNCTLGDGDIEVMENKFFTIIKKN
tara:strand:- start:1582 stop:3252 length:1671 start_codon:yes stop_codon:yes gene_type:complete